VRLFRFTSEIPAMFSRAFGKPPSERIRATRCGRLVDMQLPPFRQFNRIVENDSPIVMTRAAYDTCVELPGETRGKAEVPAVGRWGIVYLSFMEAFQHREDDPHEGEFDVKVLMADGFNIPKTLKVVLDNEFDGDDGFVFMLPHERWPQYFATN
jgi:hypothetical protein